MSTLHLQQTNNYSKLICIYYYYIIIIIFFSQLINNVILYNELSEVSLLWCALHFAYIPSQVVKLRVLSECLSWLKPLQIIHRLFLGGQLTIPPARSPLSSSNEGTY